MAKATGIVKKKAGKAVMDVLSGYFPTNTTEMNTKEDTLSDDANMLSGSKRSMMLSPKALTEEDPAKAEEMERMMNAKQDFVARADRDNRICQIQVDRLQQINDKIVNYKKERESLPQDADGIYIIVSGAASILNQFEPKYDYGGY